VKESRQPYWQRKSDELLKKQREGQRAAANAER
jgi:hypothetical protein